MGSVYKITVTCESGHKQTFTTSILSRAEVETAATLMDGTSIFLHPYTKEPGGEQLVGKCCLCGKPFTCSVEPLPTEE